jgi:hypothetical protein
MKNIWFQYYIFDKSWYAKIFYFVFGIDILSHVQYWTRDRGIIDELRISIKSEWKNNFQKPKSKY